MTCVWVGRMNGEWKRMWQTSCCPKGEDFEECGSGGDGNPFRASLPMSERGNNCCMPHLQREIARMAKKEPAKSANAARRRMATPKTSYMSRRRNVNLVGRVCICWIRGTYLLGWRLYMRSQSATKNSQQNVKWNCSATRSVCCYCLLCCHLRCCCMQHTHKHTQIRRFIFRNSITERSKGSQRQLEWLASCLMIYAGCTNTYTYIYSWQTQSQFLSVYFGISRIKFNFLLELWANKRGKVFLETCEIVNACRRP